MDIGFFYDSHAQQETPQDALSRREKSVSHCLKEFHNLIKRELLQEFAQKKPRLLDIGCGRGGDIPKWIKSGIGYVKGVDISTSSVEECKERLAFYMRKPCMLHAEFAVCNLKLDWTKEPIYNAISMMFSLHYFLESEDFLRHLLCGISTHLEPSGVFFGCVPSGRRVLKLLGNNTTFSSPCLALKKQYEDEPQCFGSRYSFAIRDTVTEGKAESESLTEWLVFENVLEKVAKDYGLIPILEYGTELSKLILHTSTLFKPFRPQFPKDTEPSLTQASLLFCAFAFRKV